MIIPDIEDCMITCDDVPTINDAASMDVKVCGVLSGGVTNEQEGSTTEKPVEVNLTKSMNDCLEKDNFWETVNLSSLGCMWPESAQALGTIPVNQSWNRIVQNNIGHRIINSVVNLALDPTMLKSSLSSQDSI